MRRRRKRENENDLDAEMFDISVIDDVMPKKSRGKRRQAKIARSFSEVRRALGNIDENSKEDNKDNSVQEESMKNKGVVSRSRRMKIRNDRKRIIASKYKSTRERNDALERKDSFNPLDIGPLTLSNEEYAALMMH